MLQLSVFYPPIAFCTTTGTHMAALPLMLLGHLQKRLLHILQPCVSQQTCVRKHSVISQGHQLLQDVHGCNITIHHGGCAHCARSSQRMPCALYPPHIAMQHARMFELING